MHVHTVLPASRGLTTRPNAFASQVSILEWVTFPQTEIAPNVRAVYAGMRVSDVQTRLLEDVRMSMNAQLLLLAKPYTGITYRTVATIVISTRAVSISILPSSASVTQVSTAMARFARKSLLPSCGIYVCHIFCDRE